MEIIKNFLPESKYNLKSPYTMIPTRIVVHNTANDASARNEINYMNTNNLEVSFHYAVDDKEIVQAIPENRNAWHAGDGATGVGNREGIGIEICYSKSGGDRFLKAEDNAVLLIVDILKRYNWGIDKVTKHQDYSGKYCPQGTLDLGWQRFLDKINNLLVESKEYELIVDVPVYNSSNDALNRTNSVKLYEKGKYYIFNESKGMINVTKTIGSPGGWINPFDNVDNKEEEVIIEPDSNIVIEEPIEDNDSNLEENNNSNEIEDDVVVEIEPIKRVSIFQRIINFIKRIFKRK